MPAPALRADTDALVRPLAVARCDLDLYIATGFVRYPGPFAFGHESVGVVADAGPAAGVRPGDRVVVPFQLSCGRCAACKRGWTNSCEVFPFGAAYGLKPTSKTEFGGALSDLMHVPFADHMLVQLPDGIDPLTAASVADNIADGWRGVAPYLAERPGATVLVVGGLAQSVGLYAAGCAVALGAARVLYVDEDAGRRARAAALGADTAAFTEAEPGNEQFDIVVEAAGSAAGLGFAVRSTAPNGSLTSVAIHFGETTPVPLARAYYKGLTFRTGRVNARAALPHVLGCISCGSLNPRHVTHRVVHFADAADAMTDPGPKLVFFREQ
ncbi:MAG: alcohol dehydrogenase catalytic domain-containing protein [Rhodospirillales bacterium]